MKCVFPFILIVFYMLPLAGQDTIAETAIEIEDIQIPEEGTSEHNTVPFSLVEKPPIFPGCDEMLKTDLKTCFQEKVQKHIAKHLTSSKKDAKNGIRGKVYGVFVVDIDGKIVDSKYYGSTPLLEKEVLRVLALLPQMKPGKQRGKAVRVPFSIPININ